MKILAPIRATKNETASRLRGRIEVILDAAKVAGHRTGEPPRKKLRKGQKQPALPWDEIPQFMRQLTRWGSGPKNRIGRDLAYASPPASPPLSSFGGAHFALGVVNVADYYRARRERSTIKVSGALGINLVNYRRPAGSSRGTS